MSVRDRFNAAGRLQRSRVFRIVATMIVLALGIGVFTAYSVSRAAAARAGGTPSAVEAMSELKADELAKLSPEQKAEYDEARAEHEAVKATAASVEALLQNRADLGAAGLATGLATAFALAVVWLGLGLTGLLIIAVLAGVSLPLAMLGGPGWRSAGQFVGAVGLLTFAFVVLMELLRALFSPSHPVTAIARNVVNEAVRMKVSLVFIVLLLLGLAALPGLLDASTPLRYRVQNFLSWGTGGTFWIIALLTVFLAVGTVAFEQRERVIWQTMTKPVASWQYLLGKWLGVVGVAAVLLGVSTAGVFMFTEYLRNQPAQGEVRPYVAREGQISEDRLVLESQVLSARRTIGPKMPEFDNEALGNEIRRRAELAEKTDPTWRPTDENLVRIELDLKNQARTSYLTIESGMRQRYEFRGLMGVKREARPVTFRYKCSVGADDPRESLRVTFVLPNMPARVQEVPLGQMMAMPISPASIDDDGVLRLEVINGDIYRGVPNRRTMGFPPDGIMLAYPAGSYRANFARVVGVLWLKLAFLAMVGVASATFLSFAVASLVSFGVFLVAEGSKYLGTSLEYYASTDDKGNIEPFRVLVRAIAVPIQSVFQFYGDLTPTTDLVDGKLVEWPVVIQGAIVIGAVCLALYGAGVGVFRRRELATYSGQ